MMIKFEEALKIAEAYSIKTGSENVPFMDSPGRVLAEDIRSDINMPPFNKAAVDGFACRREDIEKELLINEVIPAGTVAKKVVGEGECAKIMTGAAVPGGADFVFMVEDAVETGNRVRYTGSSRKDNIARKAEDISIGDIVLKKGRIIRPQDIAVMATVGATEPLVSKRIRLGVISTGDELVEPGDMPGEGQIRNSNAYQLVAQSIRAGAEALYFGIAPDNEEQTFNMVAGALDNCDILLLTGGVSMGDFDFVPRVLANCGVKILFDRVAVQPGKPTTFGTRNSSLVFGLPGNPVSSFVQFELFVRPLVLRSMGSDWRPDTRKLALASAYKRKRGERLAFVPVRVDDNEMVEVLNYHGSAHINALPDATGLMMVPLGITEIGKGEKVDVRSI
ncbi:MAG: gephyrin-like molybdotransferase Glp [Marinilabiliaceae bacterium]|jgi:molybdopterin molybdotransferase|nr:gephyrin-like molybdotransferase Glp [Marinilabiliaceae bacterium]